MYTVIAKCPIAVFILGCEMTPHPRDMFHSFDCSKHISGAKLQASSALYIKQSIKGTCRNVLVGPGERATGVGARKVRKTTGSGLHGFRKSSRVGLGGWPTTKQTTITPSWRYAMLCTAERWNFPTLLFHHGSTKLPRQVAQSTVPNLTQSSLT